MSFVKVENITFKYPDGTVAVENVSFEIDKGEKVAIVGQNGAGKTTMVKLINGLLKPSIGSVIVDSWNTKDYTTAKMSRKVGYVFQNPDDQIFHNTVIDEVMFGPKKMGYSTEEMRALVKKAIVVTELDKYIDENPYNLPYSIRKFVTIAAVISMGTEIIILDEPTAGQDMKGIKTLNKLIETLHKEGKTVITITHDMEFVVNNFDRVIVMAHKNVIEDGDKRSVFWKKDVLVESKLKQPHMSSLADKLNFGEKILFTNELVENIENYKGSLSTRGVKK